MLNTVQNIYMDSVWTTYNESIWTDHGLETLIDLYVPWIKLSMCFLWTKILSIWTLVKVVHMDTSTVMDTQIL